MGITLCENRLPLQGSPSLCTLDVSILPLPSILFLLSLPPIFVLSKYQLTRNSDRPTLLALTTSSRPLRRWLHLLYAFLVFCTIGMRALEIARMAMAQMGVGLLPIGLVPPVLILGGMLWRGVGRGRGFTISSVVSLFWLVTTIILAVKSFRIRTLLDADPAKETQYPTSDYLLDNIVMMGLALVMTVLESKHCVTVYTDTLEQQRVHDRAIKTVGTVMTGVSMTPTLV